MIYIQIVDQVNQEKKYSMARADDALFDLVGEEEKAEFEIQHAGCGRVCQEKICLHLRRKCWASISADILMEEYEEQVEESRSPRLLWIFSRMRRPGRTKVHDGV